MIALYIFAAFLAGVYLGYVLKVERAIALEEDRHEG